MTHIWRSPKWWKEFRAQARKLTSSQASSKPDPNPEPRVQASSPSAQAPRSLNQGTSAQAHDQGNRKQG